MAATPPRHAWAWFARQHLLWRHVRRDLAKAADPVGSRYLLVEDRDDVLERLRRDYPVDDEVAATLHRRLDADIFLGRADRGLEALGIRNAPRGLRWWWSAITGRPTSSIDLAVRRDRRQLQLDVGAASGDGLATGGGDAQLALDEVRYGWGDR